MFLEDGKRLCLDGFMYTKHSQNAIHWRCVKRTSRHCPARLKTNLDRGNPVGDIARHSHPADNTDVDVTWAKAAMKREAGRGPSSRVYGESVAVLSEAAKSRMPKETSKSSLQIKTSQSTELGCITNSW